MDPYMNIGQLFHCLYILLELHKLHLFIESFCGGSPALVFTQTKKYEHVIETKTLDHYIVGYKN